LPHEVEDLVMERSIAARSPVSSLDILWRPFEVAGSLARSSFQAIARYRRLRIALLTALVALPLLAGGWLLLRKSSFTAVEHVEVSGLHGPQAQAIEAALDGAASHMSTLDVHPAALRAAVASFPVVSAVRATPSFPHGLRIEVTEQLPVAALTIEGTRTAVAADGVVLGSTLLSSSLPALSEPQGATQTQPGQRLQGQSLLADLTVLGAAPRPLARFVARVYTSPGGQGLTMAMHNGLLVYFGDAARPHAKWLSLARVLADSTSLGAVYIDVRVPERPAAGFSSADAPSASTASTGQQQATTPESTVAALAAGLTDDTNGQPAASSTATTPTSASTSTTEAATSTVPAEAGSSTGTAGTATTSEPEPAASATAPDG
jgi:cell division protein FtsQ